MLNTPSKKRGPTPEYLINTYRRFGRFGPAYEIMGISQKLKSGDVLMKVHIFESDEDVEYPLSNILNDPLETN
jgi:Family of unknown function (DUF5397)